MVDMPSLGLKRENEMEEMRIFLFQAVTLQQWLIGGQYKAPVAGRKWLGRVWVEKYKNWRGCSGSRETKLSSNLEISNINPNSSGPNKVEAVAHHRTLMVVSTRQTLWGEKDWRRHWHWPSSSLCNSLYLDTERWIELNSQRPTLE